MNQDCTVCLAEHDEEIHAATVRVHAWFRTQATKHLHFAVAELSLDSPILHRVRPTSWGLFDPGASETRNHSLR